MIEINDKLKIYYPLKLKPRDQQIEGFNFFKRGVNNGFRYFLMGLPVGSGKSYMVMMIINYYKNYINNDAKFDILTNSKLLQTQYMNDFPFLKDYRGRANFYCDPHDTDCGKGKNICKVQGPHCTDCPYDLARKSWQASQIGLTNFHLYNTLAVYVKKIIDERDSSVLFVDESHDFESTFCSFITTSLSAKSLKMYGFNLKEIEDMDRTIGRIKTIDKYVGYIENQLVKDIKDKIFWLDDKMQSASKKLKQEYSKYMTHCEGQLSSFDFLIKEYRKNPKNWILETTKTKDKMYSGILLEAKPVWGNDYIKEAIFDKYDHVIFLSATILDKKTFSFTNGLDEKLTTHLELPSTFPINRHPIYYLKVGKMTWKEKKETFKKQLKYIDKILKKNKGKKGIIHAGTYEFVSWLQEKYMNPRLIFHTPENRDEMLQRHINSDEPTVLVSPSMISGIDLKDDLSRFQIILKIPFPNLGSDMVKQRMATNKVWYNIKTVQDLIQMSGRSMRSNEDWCETFVLDSSFSDLIKYSGHLLPRTFTDSIKILKL